MRASFFPPVSLLLVLLSLVGCNIQEQTASPSPKEEFGFEPINHKDSREGWLAADIGHAQMLEGVPGTDQDPEHKRIIENYVTANYGSLAGLRKSIKLRLDSLRATGGFTHDTIPSHSRTYFSHSVTE